MTTITNTFGPANAQSAYLPIEFDFPADADLLKELITKRERLTASILNVKEIGQYELVELINAQQWFSVTGMKEPNKQRYAFRKTFDIVALNAGVAIPAGPTNYPHGITGIKIPTRTFGTATTTGPVYLPLPYPAVLGNDIEVNIDSTNININNNFGSDLTQCYIVFEYLKQ